MGLHYTVYIAAIAVLALLLVYRFIVPAHDAREPPTVHSRIPFIGHAINVSRQGRKYYAKLCAETKLPAFTIHLLNQKAYMIISTNLVSSVQRNSKVISFEPLAATVAERVAGITGDGLKLYTPRELGGTGMVDKLLQTMHSVLLGADAEEMFSVTLKVLKKSLDNLQPSEPIELFSWCRHAVTAATTDAIYGPRNPYKERDFEDAMWIYEAGIDTLALGIFPSLIAREAYNAREKLKRRFEEYYAQKEYTKSSPMTEKRLKTHRESGMSYENIAKMEVTMGIAFLSNTIPSIFWVLFDVFSRPQLLAELREEITQGALHIESSNNDLPNQSKTTHTLDMNSLRDNCPLLLATWQETLRLRANVAAVRLVYKDTIINDNYLLKAGSLVQMPSNVLNLDPQTWGNDAFDYNPTRFLGSNDIGTTKRESKRNGFLTFGTSPWTCPGRHFATAEALALISMFVMRFDFTPVSGVWKSPEVNETKMALSVPPPAGELMVNIVPRQGTKGESWEFKALKGKTKFSLVTG